MNKREEKYWGWVKEIGWDKDVDFDKLEKKVNEKWTRRQIDALSKFCNDKVGELMDAAEEYEKKSKHQLQIFSDDGYWDLCWHVVGLGREEYEKNLKNPLLLEERYESDDYEENFGYLFQ